MPPFVRPPTRLVSDKADRFMMQGAKRRKERAQTVVWLTPPWLLARLGEFGTDPCAAVGQPWRTAERMLTEKDDGLRSEWTGRAFVNPPYGLSAVEFIRKLTTHSDGGILLCPIRADTHYFHDLVWGVADCMLVVRRRSHFFTPDGVESTGDTGAATVLFGYGETERDVLTEMTDLGYFTILEKR